MTTDFSNVYWIGGGSGAGKSTIAGKLADHYGCEIYSTDNVMGEHSSKSNAEHCPNLALFKNMSMDERLTDREPSTMLETFHWFNGEAFDLIIDDLSKYPGGRTVIVEGFRLLPRLVKPYLRSLSNGIWLIPTPEFRFTAFETRGSLWDIPNKTSQPEKALKNLLVRDSMFTDRLQAEAVHEDCPIIMMDGTESEDEVASRVAKHFRLSNSQ